MEMKNKILFFGFLVLLVFHFFQTSSFSQKNSQKASKIQAWEIFASVDYWYFCRDENGNYDNTCVDKVKIKFENNSRYKVSRISFVLEIKLEDATLYRKKHTLFVDIEPGEVVSYDVKLAGKVTAYSGYDYSDFDDFIEIVSAK